MPSIFLQLQLSLLLFSSEGYTSLGHFPSKSRSNNDFRLVTIPFFIHSEKLVARRFAIQSAVQSDVFKVF